MASFSADGDCAEVVFDHIVIDEERAAVDVVGEAWPTSQGVVDRFGGTAAVSGLGADVQ